MRIVSLICVFSLVMLTTLPVMADWEEGPTEEESPAEAEETSQNAEDEAFLAGEEATPEIAPPEEDDDKGLAEDPDKQYFAVGARLRWIMIPEWFIKMFGVDTKQSSDNERGLPLISNVGVGPEFIYRKNGFDITAAIWYAGLGWNDISMKGNDENEESWEVIENDMRAMLFTADFIWSTDITPWVAITYGAGLGFGVRWGDVVETEASAYTDYLEPCKKENELGHNEWGNPDYPGCTEPLGEGEYGETYDKFKVFPWIEFLVGARFKPHRNVSIYVDGGFSLGFQLGLRTHYIF